MKIRKDNKTTIYFADDIYEARGKNPEYDPVWALERILNREQQDYLKLYSQLLGLDNLGILDAHGSETQDKEWVFYDGEKKVKMQEWINYHLRAHHALALLVCNPHAFEVSSTKAALIITFDYFTMTGEGGLDEDSSNAHFGDGKQRFNLWIPKTGYLDGYVLEYETRELKEKLKAKLKKMQLK